MREEDGGLTRRGVRICGPGLRTRAVVEFVRLDRFVVRRHRHRRLVHRDSTAGCRGCFKYQGRARRDITVQARREGQVVARRGRTGAIRGGGRAQRGSFAPRGRFFHGRVRGAPLVER